MPETCMGEPHGDECTGSGPRLPYSRSNGMNATCSGTTSNPMTTNEQRTHDP